MRAAVLHAANQPLTIEEIAVNKPGPREVLLRTAFAGLCHSDLHFIEGLYPIPTPVVLGHESSAIARASSRLATNTIAPYRASERSRMVRRDNDVD